ncbi:mucin-5AC-like isoform X2 [Sabethes cyaneus]|uniref:mucin-5AC-like isoform X2 n=1 Tax=Sabethes cyaneus TaxID=53552 RepID=UPI00237DDC5D|nr:mucin-5AC-like isoform X2 [Sabethes cyaneus]XP_053692224.1 mucin-5AC-like isoform X2 [Sabethes cyaneus]
MLSGLDTLLQAAQFLEQQEQQHQLPHRLSSDVTIIPTNSCNSSVHNNNNTNNSNSTISFIPTNNSTSISESRFLPPIGKISNGTVILTAAGIGQQNGATTTSGASPDRIIAPLNGASGGIAGTGTITTPAVVTGLVPQGTTAYLTTASSQHSVTLSSLSSSSPRHPSSGAAIVSLVSGSRKRTISNASSHSSSGGYGKDEPLVNGHSTAPPLVVISTNGSSSISSSNTISSHQKHHPASSLTIDLSTKSSSGGNGHPHLSSTPPSSGCSSSSSTLTISPVDDSQSSLNLSSGSSGYITSNSANSSSSLNLSGSNSGSSPLPLGTLNGIHGSNSPSLPHDLVIVQQQQQQQHQPQQSQQQLSHLVQVGQSLGHIPTGGRRRTTSSNSNGVGTREVHNKLEKNRRAHLKECFEQLKKQLTMQPDEKKTSNLSILHAAIRHIQLLKRREREYEHEMERLAKEKIAAQNRILVLKREMSQWGDVDFSRLATDTSTTEALPNGASSSSSGGGTSSSVLLSDRDLLNDTPGVAPGRNGLRYSSSSSLSSVATTASLSNLPLQTTISPVMMSSTSPTRASPPSSASSLSVNRNTNSPAAIPLSLTTKGSPIPVTIAVSADTHNGGSNSPSPLKLAATSGSSILPNGLNMSTIPISNSSIISNGNPSGGNISNSGSFNGTSTATALPLFVGGNNMNQSQLFTPVTATILTANGGTSIQTLPLNLNVTSTMSNGSGSMSSHAVSSVPSSANSVSSSIVNGLTGSSGSSLQIIGKTANGTTIPAGLISATTGKELLNGTRLPKNGFRTDGNKIEIITAPSNGGGGSSLDQPATKVIKLVNGNTIVGLTAVDKVVQQGGLMVSPIQLLASAQGLRVIQQAPNGLATIELSTPANVQSQSNQTQRTTGGSGSMHGTTVNNSNTSSLHLSSQLSNQSSQTSTHQSQQPQIQQMTSAQLHKLLLSSTGTNGLNGFTNGSNGLVTSAAYANGNTTSITPELARLPGGAELNILPAGTNGTTAMPLYRTTGGQQGKLSFVNAISSNGTGLTLKGTDSTASSNGSRTAVHVVTPIQTSAGQLSGLTPVMVSRYDPDSNLPALFTTTATGSQTTTQLGKVGSALLSRN